MDKIIILSICVIIVCVCNCVSGKLYCQVDYNNGNKFNKKPILLSKKSTILFYKTDNINAVRILCLADDKKEPIFSHVVNAQTFELEQEDNEFLSWYAHDKLIKKDIYNKKLNGTNMIIKFRISFPTQNDAKIFKTSFPTL